MCMSSVIRALALCGAVATVGCGATTSSNPPVSSPPVSRAPSPTTTSSNEPTQVNSSPRGVIPSGQEMDVRLQSTLSSETATVEQRFEATTAVDLMQDGRVLVPSGAIVRGVVSGVRPAGRLERAGSLTLSFDQMVVRGREYNIRGTATSVFQSGGIREEAGTAGVGAGVGGVIGGLLGGVKGAILGAVIGAGGAIAATDGKDIELPAGSVIRIRLDSAVNVS